MLRGFGKFIMRGNVVDLAVAVVIGAAFGAVVTALVKDLLTPFITALVGKPDFSQLSFTINSSTFHYGEFLNSIISFVLISAAIYFFVVAPTNHILEHIRPKQADAEPAVRECPECLSEIPAAAKRCRACTAVVIPVSN